MAHASPIIVIGAHGHLGSRILDALTRAGHTVIAASRRPRGETERHVDLRDPGTFDEAFKDVRAIVNASSTHLAAPDALARYCLEQGLLLFEASADAKAVVRLLDNLRAADGQGAVVLGVGIFPGLSNQLAAAALDRSGADAVALAVRSTPLSGAGAGTVDLMTDALSQDRLELDDGVRIRRAGVERSEAMPFRSGSARGLRLSFAEPAMLAVSRGVKTAWMALSPYPAVVRWAFMLLPSALVTSSMFRWLLGFTLGFLRRWVLSRRPSSVDLVARAHSPTRTTTLRIACDDGMRVGGIAAAAQVDGVLAGKRPSGCHTIDELIPLEATLARMKEIAPETAVELEAID